MGLFDSLLHVNKISIRQKKELTELIGFETRNKYSIETADGKQLAFAAEQQKGFFGFLFRQSLGHWRTFDILFFDEMRKQILTARHPFRFLFQRIEIIQNEGKLIGAIQQRFGIINKKFDIETPNGEVYMTMKSPVWRIWTFPISKNEREVATIRKKWSGILKEAFTDSDNFTVEFQDQNLNAIERTILAVAAIFIDIKYFEVKSRN